MIHIGICDDNAFDIEKIHHTITNTFINDAFEYQIHEYTSSKSFLNGFHEFLFDIVLLDIEIDEQDGLSISKQLQDAEINPIILFITSHYSFMKDAFGYHVYKYILKEEINSILPDTLHSVIKKLIQNKHIVLPSEDGQITLNYQDICYIEYENRKIYVTYKNQHIQIYISSLKKVLELINNSDFIQVNNRYIINLNYVQSMKEGLIIMEAISIDIPKGKRKSTYQNYQKFILEKYKNV